MASYKKWPFSQLQNFVNINPRFNIQYLDIVLLLIWYHELKISDGQTDIQVCSHYNFRRVDVNIKCLRRDDDGHKVMRRGHITTYGHIKKK